MQQQQQAGVRGCTSHHEKCTVAVYAWRRHDLTLVYVYLKRLAVAAQ
jgi:hypothetical protein